MKQPVLISVAVLLAFSLGATVMWAWKEKTSGPVEPLGSALSATQKGQLLDDVFNDDFFQHSRDPFAEMERLRNAMDTKLIGDPFGSGFDRWFEDRFGSLPGSAINVEETDDTVVYRLQVEQALEEITVEVEKGYVSVEAEARSESESEVSRSHFVQRFPLPAGVEAGPPTIAKSDDEIVITFNKAKG